MSNTDIRPKYQVEHVQEPLTLRRRIASKVTETIGGKGGKEVYRMKYETKDVTYPEHWVVYFPRKHFIRVLSETELMRLGYHREAPLVDIESGEDVPRSYGSMSLKEACIGESLRQRA